jgi:hypothetical protein
MQLRVSWRAAVVISAVTASIAAIVLDRTAPPPSADVAVGTEECFGSGLFGRELPPPRRVPQRWTSERAVFRFRELPAGPVRVRVDVHGQRAPVAVAAQGQALGTIPKGGKSGEWSLSVAGGDVLEVELRAEPFVAWGGRRLGVQLDRVMVLHEKPTAPSGLLVLEFVGPALVVVASALLGGVPPLAAAALSGVVSVGQALAVWPSGLVRSAYAPSLAGQLCAGALVALAAALWFGRRSREASGWAFGSVLAAVLVQGIGATSPVMVVSDAEFHANKLAAVSRGGAFPTSITPGDRPFRFPYGVSFYAVLAPLAQAGFDRLLLVRWGAALAGVAASVALFGAMVSGGARRAALATLMLQMAPVTFDLYSYGNLSNVFGQAATVGFFAWWWTASPASSVLVGATLLAAAGLAHLSSAIVVALVCGGLALMEGRSLLADRRRVGALLAGLAAIALYYSHFVPLVIEQLPRLAGRGGAGASGLSAVVGQSRTALDQWGLAAALLGALGVLRGRFAEWRPALAAWGLAGLALAFAALVSPLEVRYLYALTLPLAVVAAEGVEWLLARGPGGAVLAGLLLSWQACLAIQGVVEGILHRYRA